MSKPESLKDLYTDELKDLWSANDQMARAVKKFAPKITDATLKDLIEKWQDGISGHTDLLKSLLESNGEKVSKEHCKGMEGLAAEAVKHAAEEAPDKGPVLDAVIIAQYQRMTHYGIAGFGTAAAFASALGLKSDVKQLKAAVKEMYGSDEFLTKLAETSVNIQAE
jgi:ferritin-like metal-binding protein YciE